MKDYGRLRLKTRFSRIEPRKPHRLAGEVLDAEGGRAIPPLLSHISTGYHANGGEPSWNHPRLFEVDWSAGQNVKQCSRMKM